MRRIFLAPGQEQAAPEALAGEMLDHAAQETFPRVGCDQAGGVWATKCEVQGKGALPTNVTVSSGLSCGAGACVAGQQGNEEGLAFNLSKVYCVKIMI